MSNLQFQDFSLGGDDSPFTSVNSNNDSRDPGSTRDSSNLIGDGTETQSQGTSPHVLSFKFYQRFFDVDTEQVQQRLMNSAVPKVGGNFIRDHVQPMPDLYGPFWISVTLVFFAGICGNFAHYISSNGATSSGNDFRLVTGVACLIFAYVVLVPFAVYSLLWYRNATIQYTYAELLCAFGYSLAVFIPVSVLWIVQIEVFRWMLIAVSVALSGTVLAFTVWEAIRNDPNRLIALGTVAGVLVLHGLLAVAIKEFYFDTVIPAVPDAAKPAVAVSDASLPTALPLVLQNKTASAEKPKAQSLVADVAAPAKPTSREALATQQPSEPVHDKVSVKSKAPSEPQSSPKPVSVSQNSAPSAKE